MPRKRHAHQAVRRYEIGGGVDPLGPGGGSTMNPGTPSPTPNPTPTPTPNPNPTPTPTPTPNQPAGNPLDYSVWSKANPKGSLTDYLSFFQQRTAPKPPTPTDYTSWRNTNQGGYTGYLSYLQGLMRPQQQQPSDPYPDQGATRYFNRFQSSLPYFQAPQQQPEQPPWMPRPIPPQQSYWGSYGQDPYSSPFASYGMGYGASPFESYGGDYGDGGGGGWMGQYFGGAMGFAEGGEADKDGGSKSDSRDGSPAGDATGGTGGGSDPGGGGDRGDSGADSRDGSPAADATGGTGAGTGEPSASDSGLADKGGADPAAEGLGALADAAGVSAPPGGSDSDDEGLNGEEGADELTGSAVPGADPLTALGGWNGSAGFGNFGAGLVTDGAGMLASPIGGVTSDSLASAGITGTLGAEAMTDDEVAGNLAQMAAARAEDAYAGPLAAMGQAPAPTEAPAEEAPVMDPFGTFTGFTTSPVPAVQNANPTLVDAIGAVRDAIARSFTGTQANSSLAVSPAQRAEVPAMATPTVSISPEDALAERAQLAQRLAMAVDDEAPTFLPDGKTPMPSTADRDAARATAAALAGSSRGLASILDGPAAPAVSSPLASVASNPDTPLARSASATTDEAPAVELAAANVPTPPSRSDYFGSAAPSQGGSRSASPSSAGGGRRAEASSPEDSVVAFTDPGATITPGRMTVDPLTATMMDSQGNKVFGNGYVQSGAGKLADIATSMIPGGILGQLASMGLTGRSLGSNFARGEPLTDPTVGIRDSNAVQFGSSDPLTGAPSTPSAPTQSASYSTPAHEARSLAELMDPTGYGYGSQHRFWG